MKLGESREDYPEAAYILKRQKGYVRNCLLKQILIIIKTISSRDTFRSICVER